MNIEMKLKSANYGLRATSHMATAQDKIASKLWYFPSSREQHAIEKIRKEAIWTNPQRCRICGGTEEPGLIM